MPYIPNHIYDAQCHEEAGHDRDNELRIAALSAEIKSLQKVIDKLLDRMAFQPKEPK